MIGSKVYYFDRIDSTNEYAKSLIKKVPEGTVIRADQQREGKGRFSKNWYSPEEGLWMSVILRPTKTSLITIAAGVAVCETLHMSGVIPGLKWPNDILLNGKKIGGILTEIVDDTVVLGIGLNLNIRKFPRELRGLASSVFIETKRYTEKDVIYAHLCERLDSCYLMLKNGQISELLTEWRYYTIVLGQEVMIEMGDKSVSGRVLDISNDGALVLRLPDSTVELIIGGTCHLQK